MQNQLKIIILYTTKYFTYLNVKQAY